MLLFPVVRVVFDHRFKVCHVQTIEELLHGDLLFIELDKELLGVASGLCTRASTNMLLNSFPFLAVFLKRFQKAEMLLPRPATGSPLRLFLCT